MVGGAVLVRQIPSPRVVKVCTSTEIRSEVCMHGAYRSEGLLDSCPLLVGSSSDLQKAWEHAAIGSAKLG